MANNEKKMTNAVAFALAIEALHAYDHPDTVEAIAKMEKALEGLKKKSSGSGKPTAKQTANMGLGELVVDFLADNPNSKYTVTQLMKEVPGLPAEITNQKLTAILRMESVKAFVHNFKEKNISYFQYKENMEG